MQSSAKLPESRDTIGRVGAFDLLRLLAVSAVILFHFGFNGPTGNGITYVALPQLADVAKYGYLGVQLFFVISGFVIAYSADGRSSIGFAIARAARIYPAFLFCMTITFLLTLAFGAPSFETNVAQWTANIFIAAPALKQPYIDSVYWTILLELTFYGWIFLMMVGGLFRRKIVTVVFVWLALSLLNEAFLGSYVIRKIFLTDQSGFFATGLLLYELYTGRRDAAVQCVLALASTGAVLQAVKNVEWFRVETGASFDNWVVAAVCLAIIVMAMLAVRVRRMPLPPYLIVAIGGLTYPLYLLHQQIGYIVFLRLKNIGYADAFVAAIVVSIAIASWATWRYVERPGQRLMKRGLNQAARWLGWATDASAPNTNLHLGMGRH